MTNSASVPNAPDAASFSAARPWQVWSPGATVLAAGAAVALAAGAFNDLLLPPYAVGEAVRPALEMLLAGQAGLLLLLMPLMRLPAVPCAGRQFAAGWLQSLAILGACAPLYVLAAYLSQRQGLDVARGLLYLLAVATAATGLRLWTGPDHRATRPVALWVGAVAALGAPGLVYLLRDVVAPGAVPAWLADITPALKAFSVARAEGLLPRPLWGWAFWAAVGGGLAGLRIWADKARH